MKINFLLRYAKSLDKKTVDFDLPENPTVMELVEIVVTRYPPMRRELLNESGELWPHVHVFVNGRDHPYLENGPQTIIKPTDTVNIFPAVGGG